MNETNATNPFITGSGTTTDPYIYHFSATGHAIQHYAALTFVLGLCLGFGLGLLFAYFRRRRTLD